MHLKKVIIIVLLFLSSNLMAQSGMTDSLNRLYDSYFQLLKNNQQLSDSIQMLNKALFTNVDTKLERITNDLSQSLEKVNRMTKNDLLTKQARLNTKKQKIICYLKQLLEILHSAR